MQIKHTAAVESVEDVLTVAELTEFVEALPSEVRRDPGVQVSAIMRDGGTQRDPVPYLHGLRVTWESPA